MVSIARVNVYYDDDIEWLQNQNTTPVYAAVLQGKSVYSCEKVQRGILLIGNESKGIRQELLNHSTEQITIPKKGEADSLNAAVATGIILSHLLPQ
jgi:TrmH family RNA methyltransferase